MAAPPPQNRRELSSLGLRCRSCWVSQFGFRGRSPSPPRSGGAPSPAACACSRVALGPLRCGSPSLPTSPTRERGRTAREATPEPPRNDGDDPRTRARGNGNHPGPGPAGPTRTGRRGGRGPGTIWGLRRPSGRSRWPGNRSPALRNMTVGITALLRIRCGRRHGAPS